ncbi:MAG: preprotein translocase subunit SecE [Lachnospiraceae bacterium]|nr:preprotein translocase subunit SecE [Lachnospiraceae bacterium]
MGETKTTAKADNKIKSFWKGLKAEFKRIIWPDKASVARQTFTVTIVTIIIGIIIALVDSVIKFGLDNVFKF